MSEIRIKKTHGEAVNKYIYKQVMVELINLWLFTYKCHLDGALMSERGDLGAWGAKEDL